MIDALSQDPHLQAFISIPGKDNGLDIEGLVVAPTGQLFVGLRGPVPRGWAVTLELPARRRQARPPAPGQYAGRD